MNWDKETVGRILSVVLSALLALLSVFGYHVVVVQPQLQAAAALANQLCR